MIQIIRPIPKYIDPEHVQQLAGMSRELVRAHLHGYQIDRRDRLQREDRDRFDRYIEAAQFVLSEAEPFETRIARTRAEMERIEYHLRQHRDILARLEAELREHAIAADELCLMAQRAEVAA